MEERARPCVEPMVGEATRPNARPNARPKSRLDLLAPILCHPYYGKHPDAQTARTVPASLCLPRRVSRRLEGKSEFYTRRKFLRRAANRELNRGFSAWLAMCDARARLHKWAMRLAKAAVSRAWLHWQELCVAPRRLKRTAWRMRKHAFLRAMNSWVELWERKVYLKRKCARFLDKGRAKALNQWIAWMEGNRSFQALRTKGKLATPHVLLPAFP